MSIWNEVKEQQLKDLLETETIQEAANRLGCHIATVKRAINRLGIKIRKKTGSNYRITRHWPAHFTSEQNQVLTACLLGDGMITKTHPSFRVKQSLEQAEYIQYLHEFFRPYTTPMLYYEEFIYRGSVCKSVTCGSYTENRFVELRSKWYPDGMKIVPKDIDLTPLGCAHWFVQDGHNRQDKREAILHTNAFTVGDVEFLIKMLRVKLNIKCHWRFKRLGCQPIIVMGNQFGDEGYFEFLEMIRPHMKWNCFAYKVDVSEAIRKRSDRPGPKLNIDKARNIRMLSECNKYSQQHLASKFGVSQPTISSIINHLSWPEPSTKSQLGGY